MTGGTIQVTRDELRKRLTKSGATLPEQLRMEIADKLCDELLRDPDTHQNRGPIIASPLDADKYYVVPGDDLGQAETAIELTVGLLGMLANPIPLLGAVSLLLFKFHRKSIPLNTRQAMVVITLIKAPDKGWTPSDVSSRLPPELGLDAAGAQQILEELKGMTRRGQPAPVVRELNGRWWTNDVW